MLRQKLYLLLYPFAVLIFLYHSQSFAQNIVPTFSNPMFWTCEIPPALPANSPRSAIGAIPGVQASCGEQRISGWHMMVNMATAAGNVPAGTSVIQTITASGIHGRTTATSTTCGDDLSPFAIAFVEYFSTPVNDLHQTPFCCEETFLDNTRAQVAFLPLPAAGVRPIPAGENASTPYTTAAQHRAIRNQVRQNATLYWGYTQEYDGCDPNAPATSCGGVHCLERYSQSRTHQPSGGFRTGPRLRSSHKDDGQ